MVDERLPVAFVELENQIVAQPIGSIDRMASKPGQKRLQPTNEVCVAVDLAGGISQLEA